MELSIRDWMIVIGFLLFVAVVLDGLRRAQRDRRNRVRLSRKAERARFQSLSSSEEAYPSELPSGGRRPLTRAEQAEQDRKARQADAGDEPQQPGDYAVDPLFSNPFEHTGGKEPEPQAEPQAEQAPEPQAEPEPMPEEPLTAARDNDELVQTPSMSADEEKAQLAGEPEEILVLHVLAGNGEGFAGEDLVESLLRYDCRLGEMNIFHRRDPGSDSIRFSVANSVEPGTFNLDDIKNFTTPGVSFFMRLPGPENPLKAFDNMVETAYYLARHHNGRMRDENHSTLTEQTLEHDRQRIRDYLQKQMVRT